MRAKAMIEVSDRPEAQPNEAKTGLTGPFGTSRLREGNFPTTPHLTYFSAR
jgi:hypothetical protein